MPLLVPQAILDNESKKIKRNLEGWREILVPAYSYLNWETPATAGIIAGSVSILFLIFWYMDPCVLSLTSGITFMIVLLDYMVPIISAHLFRAESWTATKERELDDICAILAGHKLVAARCVKGFFFMRSERPKMFYPMVLSTLGVLTWLGNSVNNFLLAYLIVMTALLAPGLKKKGLFGPALAFFKNSIYPLVAKETKTE